jgi:hypothetical protein
MSSEYAAVPSEAVELPEIQTSTDTEANTPSSPVPNTNQLEITFFQVSKPKKVVSISRDITVRELKAFAFADDVALNKRIRFIHHGQVLDDNKALKDTGLVNSQFVHVAITDPFPHSTVVSRVKPNLLVVYRGSCRTEAHRMSRSTTKTKIKWLQIFALRVC